MPTTFLYDDGTHRNLLFEDFGGEEAVQANQHMIIDGKEGFLLDPGGHKVYSKVLSQSLKVLKGGSLKTIFLSHQDPDVVAALNGWLMTTDATAYSPEVWFRFIPHFGLNRLVIDRLKAIPDQGMRHFIGSTELLILPAHFLHSCGNFHVYDPTSKILYTGDLGASIGQDYVEVKDFEAHTQYMEVFHRRYMSSNTAMRAWAKMVRGLDIEIIAPQHGAFFRGKVLVQKFISWCEALKCGIDLMIEYKIPT